MWEFTSLITSKESKVVRKGFFIHYRLYEIDNVITLYRAGQYRDWSAAMEDTFKDQFEIVSVNEFEY